ncbi:MAG: FtsX-like permease family protein [Bacilli bacterium]
MREPATIVNREIGIFLAFGARPRYIIVQFLLVATLISLLGTRSAA